LGNAVRVTEFYSSFVFDDVLYLPCGMAPVGLMLLRFTLMSMLTMRA
jgi:hypothetical protein